MRFLPRRPSLEPNWNGGIMAETISPPFRADHVGSLIRPAELIEARKAHLEGRLDTEALREVQQRSIRDVVRMQEETGLRSITDGEYNRQTWQTDFLLRFAKSAISRRPDAAICSSTKSISRNCAILPCVRTFVTILARTRCNCRTSTPD
jgi:hypothetical protein